MNDIIERLRSTLSNEPSDDALWDRVIEERHDAALEIERLRAELDKAQHHIEMLKEKIDAEKSCACAYDDPNEVCLPHSPLLEKARAEVERLRDQIYESIPKWQANELQREINQLRDAMQFYADPNRYKSTSVHMCGHSTGQSVMIDGGRKAREALKASQGS